jgi:hypothetical protein
VSSIYDLASIGNILIGLMILAGGYIALRSGRQQGGDRLRGCWWRSREAAGRQAPAEAGQGTINRPSMADVVR